MGLIYFYCLRMCKMKGFVVAFFILFATVVFGQANKAPEIKGQVSANVLNLDNIYVINLASEQTVFTDTNGEFVIEANVGDTLLFSSLQTKRKELVLCSEDFQKTILNVYLIPMVHELNEVVVRNYNSISAESLGIVSSDQKKYTPAERKYATASSARLNPMGLDPVINLISGRSKMLKKEIAIEKKESYMVMLEKMFDREHFINTLQLPLEYIKGFEYYVVDNEKFTKILEMKNKTTIEFLLGELAVKYKAIIALENK